MQLPADAIDKWARGGVSSHAVQEILDPVRWQPEACPAMEHVVLVRMHDVQREASLAVLQGKGFLLGEQSLDSAAGPVEDDSAADTLLKVQMLYFYILLHTHGG